MSLGAAAVLALSSVTSRQAQAAWPWEGLRLGAWDAIVETDFEAGHQQTRSEGTAAVDFALRRFQEKLTVGNKGFFLYDPRLAVGSLEVTLGAVTDRQRSGGIETSSHAHVLGYGFDSSVFAGGPYSGTLYANRSLNYFTQPFGRSQLDFENRGAAFRLGENSLFREWGIPYLSANLRVEQQEIRETTTSVLGQSLHREELHNILGLDGHEGLENGDLDWRYDFNDLHNRSSPANSFRTHSANLNYSMDFGPTLNRRWDSRFSYYRLEGASPYDVVTASQQVTVDHDSELSSGYRYFLTHANGLTGATTTQYAAANVHHERKPNLTTLGDASALHETLPAGTRSQYEGRFNAEYRRALPWNGTVSAHLGGRSQLNDNQLLASRVTITDEAQSAPAPLGAGGGFLLNQPFIELGTLVIVDTRGGARLPTGLGIDYEVVQEGNRSRIVPLLTSAVIQAGDPLAISYSYDIAPSARYATNSRSFGGGIDFRWIAASYGHEQSNQTLLSGGDAGFLEDTRKDTVQLDLHGNWESIQAQGSLARLRYDSTRLSYTQQRASQFASLRPSRAVGIGLATDWTRTDFARPGRRTDARSGRVTLDWYGEGGWTTTAMASWRVYKDSTQPDETVIEATLRSRLEYGRLVVVADFAAGDRVRGGIQTKIARVALTLVRRF